MTSPAPLIQRLQAQQAQSRRMLTPGLSGQAAPARFSPVLDGIGASKYRQVVEKMRVLGPNRLGHLQPSTINQIGRDLPARFANPASLLHIKLAGARESSIWSDLETTLPSAQADSPAAQPPEEPGVLRQGSIIQRMSTTPRPGQSLEAFKAQVQSRPESSRPATPSAPARPRPRPGESGVRRFARIEEMTGKSEPPAPPPAENSGPAAPPNTIQRQVDEIPEVPPPPAEPAPQPEASPQPLPVSDSPPPVAPFNQPEFPLATPPAARPSVAQPARSTQEPRAGQTIEEAQTHPTPPSEPPAVARPVSKQLASPTLLRAEPLPRPGRPVPPPAPGPVARPIRRASASSETPPPRLRPVAPPPTPGLPRSASPQPQRVERVAASPAPIARAVPADLGRLPVEQGAPAPVPPVGQAAPLARALPVSEGQPGEPRASLPQARLSSRQAARPEKPVLSLPQARPAQAAHPGVIQRQPDIPTRGQALPPKVPAPFVRPGEMPSAPDLAAPSESPATAPALPTLAYRRAAPEQVRFVAPQGLKKAASPQPPLIPPALREARRLVTPAAPPDSGPVSPPPLASSAPLTVQRLPETPVPAEAPGLALAASQPPALEMPVARSVEMPRPAPQPSQSPSPEAPAEKPRQPQPQKAPLLTSTLRAAPNTIQRLWEEHSAPASASGRAASAGTPAQSPETALDLDRLAEEVLPLVKRLIEIESERSSGYLR